jgi:hypothetical protein
MKLGRAFSQFQLQGFDIRSNVHRLDVLKIMKTVFRAPGGKPVGCGSIGPARVWIADLGREEFKGAFRRLRRRHKSYGSAIDADG